MRDFEELMRGLQMQGQQEEIRSLDGGDGFVVLMGNICNQVGD